MARQVRVVLSLPNVIGGHGKLGPKKSLAERPCPGLYGLFRYRLRRGVCNRLAPGFQRRPLEYGLAAHIGGGLGEGRLAASLNGGFPGPAQKFAHAAEHLSASPAKHPGAAPRHADGGKYAKGRRGFIDNRRQPGKFLCRVAQAGKHVVDMRFDFGKGVAGGNVFFIGRLLELRVSCGSHDLV